METAPFFRDESITRSNPNDIDALYGLALVQEKLGASEDAEKYYKKGLSIQQKDRDILRDYGIFPYRGKAILPAWRLKATRLRGPVLAGWLTQRRFGNTISGHSVSLITMMTVYGHGV